MLKTESNRKVMSANSFWQDVKSQIPILKSTQNEPKEKNLEPAGRKWNDKLKKRSSSALSIFQVTHKVPSHIVSPKSSKEADSQIHNWKESRQYNSNIELSRCLDSVAEITDKSEKTRRSDNSYHGSAQDLTLTWWHKKPPTKNTTNSNLLGDFKEKSASISNIFNENENTDSFTHFHSNGAPQSLPGVHGFENACNSYQDLPKNVSFPYQPTLTLNRGMRKQFLSEQNLCNSSSSQNEYGLYSLDNSYPHKGMYNKMSFDISTIKELPEDRSDSPVKLLDGDSCDGEIPDHERITCTTPLSPSFADTYRSLQNLCMDVSDTQKRVSLTGNHMTNQITFENPEHAYAASVVDGNCFRSVQDLRDSTILEDSSPFSMDYKYVNNNLHSSTTKLLNDNKSAKVAEASCFDNWVDNDRSVSMMDITEIGAYRKDLSRRNSSRIPKRRHTVSIHDLNGFSLNQPNSLDSSSRLNTAQQPDSKFSTRGKPLASCEMSPRLKNPPSVAAKAPCCKKTPALERKKGCVGCQQKRHQVTRQNSMPLLKSGVMRDKTADGRKPLSRSCSNPGPAGRKPHVQEQQQKRTDQMNEKNTSYAQEMKSSRSEVERLREEVHSHRRTIRQLSLRLPRESYKENQPLSLGHIPSTSVDNVFEAFLRPGRPRHDAGEAELQELRAENRNLRSELQETRDQADLLEFRVLELTEGSDRFSEAEKATCSRDLEEKAEPQALNFEDLSLPLSFDSGLDLTADGKRARCCTHEPTSHPKTNGPQSVEFLPAAQPLCSEGPEKNEDPLSSTEKTSPLQANEKQPDAIKFDVSEQQEPGTADTDELPEIISNLQYYLDRPHRLQASLLATVEKLRSLSTSVSDLEAKVSTVTRENQYLTETLSSLNEEAQETRTEASGTESEIVSRKTPSLHSDLSDSDSDSPATDTTLAKKRFDTLSSFQESGIFEGSSEVHHAATQTEEDGEAAAATGDREQQLGLENSRLHEALEELRQNYDLLLLNAEKCPRCVEWAEVDRGEARALKEQLRVAQGARKALYDEKCELEEAENDARLMVQRLDSQLTAAREMELLLSASLSQEQEISREMHNKVKELQCLQAAEKERCYRQSLLEKENVDDRVVNLVLDKDTYSSQLEFVKHSLILLQVFRHFHLLNNWLSAVDGNEAPTEGLEAVDEYVLRSKVVEATDEGNFKERGNHINIDDTLIKITGDPVVSSPSTLKSRVDSELNFSSTFLSLDEMIDRHPKFSEFIMPGFADVSVQTEPVNLCAEFPGALESPENSCCHEPGNFSTQSSRAGATEKPDLQTKSTMTVEKDLLSLRESFYLEQIETLQEEKSVLRKEFGQDRTLSLERDGLLQDAMQDLQAQIGDSERAQAALQCEVELQKDKEETLSKDFHKYMEQTRNDQARSSELHELEKIALRRDFEARLAEVAEDRRRHADRCAELERQLSALWRELEVVGMEALTGYEGRPLAAAAASQGGEEAPQPSDNILRTSCSSHMLDAVRQLVKSERALRTKNTELEKKESAYRETMQEADQIMLSHVTSYKQRIDELEAANEQCEAKVRQLECSEDRLRSSLKNNARSDQDARVAELLEQLLTIEKSELELKHKLWNLEKNEKELKIKVIEGEKVQESLRAELRDQDDLVRKMHNLQSENSAITQQLQRAHESVRRAVDMQQTECLLKGRVEELEFSENALKNTLQQTCASYSIKERRLNQQVTAFEEEASSLKKRLENASVKETQILESELMLKRHVEALRAELGDAKRDLKVFSADESSSRTEVSRLRSHLKQANGELTEVESINCNLRERLEASEQLREALERSLEERKRRHESDLLQLNLQVSQRESRLEETEGQLCELTQLHAAQELDLLAAAPLEPFMRATRRLTAHLSLCEACSRSQGTAITDLTLQLDTLTDLLSGAPHQDDTDGEEYGDQTPTSAEEVERRRAGAATPASADPRGGEGVRCSPSFEGDRSSTFSNVSTSSDERNCERSRDSPRAVSPAPVPAPRRKRKLKRDFASSLRSSLKSRKKGGSTILEELEEKVRELEESVNTKEDELKLADCEATDLSSKLAAAHEIAVCKEAEITILRQTMTGLQHQLTLSLQNSENMKRNFESKYKEAEERLQQQAQRLSLQLQELTARGRVKDGIIGALVLNIRACLRSCNIGVIIVQIRHLREKMELRHQQREHTEDLDLSTNPNADELPEGEADHDVHSVCELLGRPQEVITRPLDGPATEESFSPHTEDSAVQTDEALPAPLMIHKQIQTTEKSSSFELSLTPVDSSTSRNEPVSSMHLETNEHTSFNNIAEASVSSTASNNCFQPQGSVDEKSNLSEERFLTSIHKSTQTLHSHFQKIGPHQKSFIPKIVKPHISEITNEVHRTISSNSYSKQSILVRGVATVPCRRRTKIGQPNLGSTVLAAPNTDNTHLTETGVTHQRATALLPIEVSNVAAPGGVISSKHSAAIRSVSLVDEVDINLPGRSSTSSIRSHCPDGTANHTCKKLKVNPITQERPRPAWQSVRRISRNCSVVLNSVCKAESSNCIPRPTELKVTRWVGKDGVVIAWEPQNHDCVAGFQVIVAGKVVQSIRSPKRTKALITGLSLSSSVSIGLVSVGVDGRCSKPAIVTCDRSKMCLKKKCTSAPGEYTNR